MNAVDLKLTPKDRGMSLDKIKYWDDFLSRFHCFFVGGGKDARIENYARIGDAFVVRCFDPVGLNFAKMTLSKEFIVEELKHLT